MASVYVLPHLMLTELRSQRMYATTLPSMDTVTLTIFLIDRTKRVKDAKTEAQKEIDEYRQKKEEEFKKYESEVLSCCVPGSTLY